MQYTGKVNDICCIFAKSKQCSFWVGIIQFHSWCQFVATLFCVFTKGDQPSVANGVSVIFVMSLTEWQESSFIRSPLFCTYYLYYADLSYTFNPFLHKSTVVLLYDLLANQLTDLMEQKGWHLFHVFTHFVNDIRDINMITDLH